MSLFCSKNEIIHQTSCSHMSQQNDVAERKHILDVAKIMMIHMHVLKYLWADAVLSVCHLIKRMPYVLHGKISFSCLYLNKSVFYILTKVSSLLLLVFLIVYVLFRICLQIWINYLLGLSNVSSLGIL